MMVSGKRTRRKRIQATCPGLLAIAMDINNEVAEGATLCENFGLGSLGSLGRLYGLPKKFLKMQ